MRYYEKRYRCTFVRSTEEKNDYFGSHHSVLVVLQLLEILDIFVPKLLLKL